MGECAEAKKCLSIVGRRPCPAYGRTSEGIMADRLLATAVCEEMSI